MSLIRTVRLALMLTTVFAGLTQQCQAAITYSLEFGNPHQTVAPGATATYELFLVETVTGDDTARISADNPLGSANYRVSWDDGGSSVQSTDDVAPSSGFDGEYDYHDVTLNDSSVGVEQYSWDGVSGTVSGNQTWVSIGLVTVTAASTPGTSTLLILDQFDSTPGADDFVLFDGFVIDDTPGFSVGTGSLSTTAVPEPGTVAICGILVVGMGVRRYRRRRAAPDAGGSTPATCSAVD